ncbi:hypothetical protein JR316_0008818 [Psilocybe cubensis]|uniref:Uncharacterized protein n=2 Tax=Psilocybe cubensis TaxID=181762 RepID=A0ACB8GSB9_PSICU|nr:hypothetical protein JR316_0008818 [Psilocybe cubensis]KAH9478364.1 hypothetical protein JR316_0008818 [Psilocybe cubensis]
MLPDTSSYFDRLTKNNEVPIDSTMAEVRKLLSDPLKQLEEIEMETKRLETKRLDIEASIRNFRRILAPVRRVPHDILCTIFEHCLPTDRNPTMAADEAPMLLTRVCSTWRSIAMGSPRLWAQIYIPFRRETDDYRYQRWAGDPVVPQNLMTTVLQNRCYAIQEWLSRSGDLPLSISIGYQRGLPRNYTANIDAVAIDKLTQMLLEILLLLSPRWQSLDINLPDGMYYELEKMLSTHTLPFLRRLRISTFPLPDWTPGRFPPTSLLRAPNLKYVSLTCGKVTDLLPAVNHVSSPLTGWSTGITNVSLSTCGLKSCVALFKSHPTLVKCNLFLEPDNWQPDNETVIPKTIHSPHLHSLWINTGGNLGLLNFAPALFNAIQAPNLQHFAYYNSSGPYGDTLSEIANDELPLSFFHGAINLTSLEIDRFFLKPSNILAILESLPRLTRLAFTAKHDITSSQFASLEMETFDLEALVIRRDVDGELNPSTSTSIQLLPCLEVFELHRAIVTDEQVLRFISSRMNPKSHIAVLKTVKVYFDRLKEYDGSLDLVEETRCRADTAGIQIHTKFRYSLTIFDVEKSRNFLSPSYKASEQKYDNNEEWAK